MAGFDNDVVYGTNVDFSGAGSGQGGNATLLLDGQLLIASTALNAGGTHINVGKIVAGTGITIGYASPNITVGLTGGGAAVEHLTGNSGGQLNPDGSNNFNILGASVAAGTTPVATAGVGSTITVNVQKSQAIASTDTTKVGLAAFDSARFSVDANGFVTLNTTGALETLSDDVSTVVTPLAGNIQLVGHVVEAGATKFSTIVAGTNLLNVNPMSSARWIVDPLGFNGTHTTIATAITSATSGDTIFLMPGTYTENITLKAGVNITANLGDGITGNATIVGKVTATFSGTVTLSGIRLQTNSDFLLAMSGAAATKLNLIRCYLNATNNSAIQDACSGGGNQLTLNGCNGDLGTTGINYFALTNNAGINFINCNFTNTGVSVTASTIAAGCGAGFFTSQFSNAITTAGSGFFTAISTEFTGPIITAGTGPTVLDNCFVATGSSSAISVGAGTSVSVFNTDIQSSNTNAITGAGTLIYSAVVFSGTSSTINTTTQTPAYTQIGKYRAAGQPAFMAFVTTTINNVTGDGTVYTIIFDTESYDNGNDFNLGTSVFTAPVTGKYSFNLTVAVTGGTTITAISARIVTTANTFNQTGSLKPAGTTDAVCSVNITCPMTAGDTATFAVASNDTGKTDDILGLSGGLVRTWCTGILVS
jgi:hypothetical protein